MIKINGVNVAHRYPLNFAFYHYQPACYPSTQTGERRREGEKTIDVVYLNNKINTSSLDYQPTITTIFHTDFLDYSNTDTDKKNYLFQMSVIFSGIRKFYILVTKTYTPPTPTQQAASM